MPIILNNQEFKIIDFIRTLNLVGISIDTEDIVSMIINRKNELHIKSENATLHLIRTKGTHFNAELIFTNNYEKDIKPLLYNVANYLVALHKNAKLNIAFEGVRISYDSSPIYLDDEITNEFSEIFDINGTTVVLQGKYGVSHKIHNLLYEKIIEIDCNIYVDSLRRHVRIAQYKALLYIEHTNRIITAYHPKLVDISRSITIGSLMQVEHKYENIMAYHWGWGINIGNKIIKVAPLIDGRIKAVAEYFTCEKPKSSISFADNVNIIEEYDDESIDSLFKVVAKKYFDATSTSEEIIKWVKTALYYEPH